MTRPAKGATITCAIIAVAAVVTVLWRAGAQRGSAAVSIPGAAHQAITSSVDFVRSRVTGGVGVAVAINSSTKLPVVGAVAIGSPANEAGLHVGDIITGIGGTTTTGLVLKQVVENLRGFTGASVPLTILRGTNHIDFVIQRTSMKSLQQKRFSPYE